MEVGHERHGAGRVMRAAPALVTKRCGGALS
jgi:hypothetical protein